jgi:repressor LexA
MLPNITPREKEVYKFIKNFIRERGIPPTNREIGEHFKIAPKNAFKYITILEKKGYIKRERKISRGLSVTDSDASSNVNFKKVPFVSYVAAGSPIDINELAEDYYVIDNKIFPQSDIFVFRVIGDSMINAHIEEGDLAIVSTNSPVTDNDIVVASIYNEITLKRLICRDNVSILHAENEKYPDIVIDHLNPNEFKIVGKVVGIIRKIS